MTFHLVVAWASMSLATASLSQTSAPRAAIQSSDPAVEAYTTFVEGKQLRVPVDLEFVVAALDRLVSAVEGLALREATPNRDVLSAARQLRQEIRFLRASAPSTPVRVQRRWTAFARAAELVDGLARELGPRGAPKALRTALLRAADSIDYDDPVRWQPEPVEIFFNLAARALKQMAEAKVEELTVPLSVSEHFAEPDVNSPPSREVMPRRVSDEPDRTVVQIGIDDGIEPVFRALLQDLT